jgi:MFS family permease
MFCKKAILAPNPPGNLANVCRGERTMCWIRKHSLPAVYVAVVAFTGATEVHSQGTSATSTAPGLDSLITQVVTERLQLQNWRSWVSASVATLLGALLGGVGGFGIGYQKNEPNWQP